MPSVNYMNDETVRTYYKRWAATPKLTQQYGEYFYQFVKACLELDKRPNIEYLKLALYDSFYKRYGEKQYDEFEAEKIILFEHLIKFSNTTLN